METRGEVINQHTLSDFRVGNALALDELFIQILGVLRSDSRGVERGWTHHSRSSHA